jgi:hypothetical protein
MAKPEVIRVALTAMTARFPNSVAANEPYYAAFRDGIWSVWGTVPSGMRGGGAPAAEIRDSDGAVMKVSLSR